MKRSWGLMDLVTVATIGIASGVLFAGWNLVWGAASPLFAAVLPLQYLLFAGTWVIAGPLTGLIVRRPGAALAGEMIAAGKLSSFAQDLALMHAMGIRIVPLSDAWSLRSLQICVRSFDSLPSFARELVELLAEDARAGEA